MNRFKKRALGWLLVLTMLINIMPTAALASATESMADEAVYQITNDVVLLSLDEAVEISSADDLQQLKNAAEGSQFVLTADITLPADWEPINVSYNDNIVFDGNGYTITLSGQPLFNNMYSLTVRNVILGGQVSSASSNLASLAIGGGSGTVCNSISYADVTYTGAAGGAWSPKHVAGFAAQYSGNFVNCVYNGIFNPGNAEAYGSICSSFFTEAKINNCIGVGSNRIGSIEGMDVTEIAVGSNTLIADLADFNPSAYVEQLNQNRDVAAGDLEWEVADGKLALKRASDEAPEATAAELAALQNAVEQAATIDTSKVYTADSWVAYNEALGTAQSVLQQANPKQNVVTNATNRLNTAVIGLAARSLAAVDLTGKEVVSITSVSGLESMTSGKFYRLDADLEITNSDLYMPFGAMNSLFDGNGHIITINASGWNGLWQELGPDAVVQNLGIKGSVSSANNVGAIAGSSQGLIINCWSQAAITTTGQNNNMKHTGGLVGQLQSGGAIINSWVAANVIANGTNTANGSLGALAGSTESNSLLQNCYRQEGTATGFLGREGAQIISCEVKARKDFYSDTFIALLNANRGGGREWTLSAEGYPHLGEAQAYTPPEAVKITFTNNNGQELEFSTEDGMQVSLQDADPSTYKAGKFSMPGAVRWLDTITDSTVRRPLLVTEDGTLSIYTVGSVDVVAISSEEDGSKELARFTVTVVEGDEIADFRLCDGDNPISGTLILQGSEQKTLTPQIKRSGSDTWQTIPASQVSFSHTGSLHRVNGTIYAEEPGNMTLTAEYMGREARVNIVSEFVAVESIVPSPNGEYVIHQRNPNSSSKGDFLDLTLSHGAGTVVVLPENASYRNKWTLTSSDNQVAEYVSSMLVAVLPKQVGTVTLTAVVEAQGQQPRVEGTSQITIKYFNPVQSVSIAASELTVKENQELALPISFQGPQSGNGWRVTEPAMDWRFEGDGAVTIVRDGELGIWEETVNGKVCEANDKYKLIGVKAGRVVVTGTPQDQTLAAAPVVFTVVVEEGDEMPPADNGALAAAGIASGQEYLMSQAPAEYAYGDEWEIFALRRSGQSLAPAQIEGYLASVEAVYRNNPQEAEMKPTTMARVVLTLGVLGENAADFRGLDFISMLCNSQQIGIGGNEPMWTLLALDSRGFAEPAGVLWSRDKLVSELILQYQNPEGGFGLNDNVTASVDMTAMAVQALAPYYESRLDVKQAVDAALGYLQAKMTWNCGFDDNVEAAAQVMLALTALGQDPTLPEGGFAASPAVNLLTNISSYRHEDGGYKHFGSDKGSQRMSTVQALLAFEAYRRWAEGENYLYDLRDVDRLAMLEQRLAEVERLDEAKYTADSWQAVLAASTAARQLLAGGYTEADLQAADEALAAAIAGLQLLKPDGANPNPGGSSKNITVSFRVIGDNQHDGAASHEKYINWVKTFNVTVPEDSTVYDVLEEALGQRGMDFEEGQHSYISGIQAPAVLGGYWLRELDNGGYSGWKYMVNGRYPSVGLRYYWLKNGDEIIWRYVDDYTDSYDDSNKWQEAEDIDPNPAMSSGGATGVSGEKTAILAPEASIDRTGAAVSSVTYKEVAEAIKRAAKDEAKSITIMPQNTGKAKSIVVSLPVDSARELAAAELGVSVDTKQGSVVVSELALAAIAGQAEGTEIRICITGLDAKAEAVQSLLEAAGLAAGWAAEVTITSGGKEINSFGGHELIINLPVDEKSFTKDASYKVIVVSGDGTVEAISGTCLRIGGELVVQVRVSHLSTFIVTNEKAAARAPMSFEDVKPGDWFYEAVRFVYEAGLMSGESEGCFVPNGNLDRGMLVTILYRLEGTPEMTAASGFSDVAAGSWYAEAVCWAAAKGIVNGYEDGSFAPAKPVSREEMAAMLLRYAEYRGNDTSAVGDLSSYADSESVSGWAQQSLVWANAAGLIQGDERNNLNPQGKATRAEAATIIRRFCEK